MRRTAAIVPMLLAACSTAPAAPPSAPPVHGETPGHTCTTDGTSQFVGQIRSDAVGAEIKRVSNAAVLRWAPPGVMLTMDYRADRVTVWLDPANKITQIKCG
jgi:hypothetical protein